MSKILIIEDDTRTRENLTTILRMEGYAAVAAVDGSRGIEAARRERPDLILCDVMMPGADGHAVLSALRGSNPPVTSPFIFLTARGDRADIRTGMNLGADDYLTKPVSARELLDAVRARLQREAERPDGEFKPDFSSPDPLRSLGLTAREAEVLLWVAQGKTNPEIGTILDAAENTVKKHLQHIFEKLGLDSRNAATLLVIEHLNRTRPAAGKP